MVEGGEKSDGAVGCKQQARRRENGKPWELVEVDVCTYLFPEILVYVGERTEYELPKELIRRSNHLLSVQTKDVQRYTQYKPLSLTFSPRGWDIGSYKI